MLMHFSNSSSFHAKPKCLHLNFRVSLLVAHFYYSYSLPPCHSQMSAKKHICKCIEGGESEPETPCVGANESKNVGNACKLHALHLNKQLICANKLVCMQMVIVIYCFCMHFETVTHVFLVRVHIWVGESATQPVRWDFCYIHWLFFFLFRNQTDGKRLSWRIFAPLIWDFLHVHTDLW